MILEEQFKAEVARLRDKEKQLRTINDFATALLEQNSVDEILSCVTHNTVSRLGFYNCEIYFVDENGKYLVLQAANGPDGPVKPAKDDAKKRKIGVGITGAVARTGVAEIISDTSDDSRYKPDGKPLSSKISVPILNDIDVVGVIDSEHPDKDFFAPAHLNVMEIIAALTAIKLQQAATMDKMKHVAYTLSHDFRSPLANIRGLLELFRNQSKTAEEKEKILEMIGLTADRMDTSIQHIVANLRSQQNDKKS